MTVQPSTSETASRGNATEPVSREFPVREYIGAMATELAQMARWDGDEALGRLLDSCAAFAGGPRPSHRPEVAEKAPNLRRSA